VHKCWSLLRGQILLNTTKWIWVEVDDAEGVVLSVHDVVGDRVADGLVLVKWKLTSYNFYCPIAPCSCLCSQLSWNYYLCHLFSFQRICNFSWIFSSGEECDCDKITRGLYTALVQPFVVLWFELLTIMSSGVFIFSPAKQIWCAVDSVKMCRICVVQAGFSSSRCYWLARSYLPWSFLWVFFPTYSPIPNASSKYNS